jgi:hypothetical protein
MIGIVDWLDALAAVSFSDAQLEEIVAAAAELPVTQRDGLLRAIAAGLKVAPKARRAVRDHRQQ